MGSDLAAFDAGYSPKNIPTTAENPTAMITINGRITTLIPRAAPPAATRLTPSITPIRPPQADNMADSVRN